MRTTIEAVVGIRLVVVVVVDMEMVVVVVVVVVILVGAVVVVVVMEVMVVVVYVVTVYRIVVKPLPRKIGGLWWILANDNLLLAWIICMIGWSLK